MTDVKKFKFVSPGIFLNEIDNSQIPRDPEDVGPVIIGTAQRGPNMRPVKVESYSEFVRMFGNPQPGTGTPDPWRDGNYSNPSYGAYAAKAYTRSTPGPVTFVKLAGQDHTDKTSAATRAGYQVTAHHPQLGGTTAGSAPGAYGLFVGVSGSGGDAGTSARLIHAATFYVERGTIALTGSQNGQGGEVGFGEHVAVNQIVNNAGTEAGSFQIIHYDDLASDGSESISGSATGDEDSGTFPDGVESITTFNFDPTSQRFIRNVFPNDPVSTNSSVTSTVKDFWGGETSEGALKRFQGSSFGSTTQGTLKAVLIPLHHNVSSTEGGDWRKEHTAPQTGWVIAQHEGANAGCKTTGAIELSGSTTSFNPQKLFKLHSLYGGEYESKNYKVSVTDIKKSTNEFDKYGTFSVEIRRADDTDEEKVVLERFSNCNLNPNSPNYICNKIGDKFIEWDSADRRYKEYNNYPNMSSFIRVEVDPAVSTGQVNQTFVPFGFYGPLRFAQLTVGELGDFGTNSFARPAKATLAISGSTIVNNGILYDRGNNVVVGRGGRSDAPHLSSSFEYPAFNLRTYTQGHGDYALSDPTNAYFGVTTNRSGSAIFDESYADLVRPHPGSLDVHASPSNGRVYSFIFSLDDVEVTGEAAKYAPGSRAAGTSYTATAGKDYGDLLDKDFNKFTMPLVGGFDGLDVTEKNPFNNTRMGTSEIEDYAYNSVKRAIDAVSDPEVVECNLMAVPGVYKTGITRHLIATCEKRADALAIIDLEGDFKDSAENTAAENGATRKANPTTTVSNLRSRGINSSYGASYFPWCTIRDESNLLAVPPSVIAMGVLSYSQSRSELWFAPAGFNRGGLTENGAAGLQVVNVKYTLSSKERDKLYDANINPIASFPSEGLVIFGQKTLQVTRSAVDRINVRRLMIFLKKEISRMAATLLFDQNVKTTWARFKSKVDPLLTSVKTRFGLSDFRIILDETTTTPELVDRNIMYAKIFLKPARAIEFIALDFIITDSGASFDDL
jgi:hypothetical protein